MSPPRVLVADDSDLCRDALVAILQARGTVNVVATASTGREAVTRTAQERPDLVVMDVLMPEMGGFEAVEIIMAEQPTPILMMTSDPRGSVGELSFEALRRGALDLWIKPSWPAPDATADALRRHIHQLSKAPVLRHPMGNRATWTRTTPRKSTAVAPRPTKPFSYVFIAASTGGPAALERILGALPADFAVPVMIVQHLPDSFDRSLASWLDRVTPPSVRVAEDGALLMPGTILIAPSGADAEVTRRGRVRLRTPPDGRGYHPSADILFHSAARELGASALGMVLTGMGRDGALGLRALADTGALTIAQDSATSLVDGMPAAARAAGAASLVLPLEGIAPFLCSRALRRVRNGS